jgi:spermidine synthase
MCFGTGQTANGVREEGPSDLDIVEINPTVFVMASFFPTNGGVLGDPRVHPIVMDARAWLRRTNKTYDVITLEPMPPNFAGVNALYSTEFYELAAQRLRPGGLLAHWLPFHLVSLEHAAAIVATFHRFFGDSILWIDPVDHSGILVGRRGAPSADFGLSFPGFGRPGPHGDMKPDGVSRAVALRGAGIARWAQIAGETITDDNQLLAYSLHRGHGQLVTTDHMALQFAIVRKLREDTWSLPR